MVYIKHSECPTGCPIPSLPCCFMGWPGCGREYHWVLARKLTATDRTGNQFWGSYRARQLVLQRELVRFRYRTSDVCRRYFTRSGGGTWARRNYGAFTGSGTPTPLACATSNLPVGHDCDNCRHHTGWKYGCGDCYRPDHSANANSPVLTPDQENIKHR